MTTEDIAVRFEVHEQEIKSLKHRMNDCESSQELFNKLINSVDKLSLSMEYMNKELQALGKRLEKLENAPMEEFKHYKRAIITSIITGVVGVVLGAIFAIL